MIYQIRVSHEIIYQTLYCICRRGASCAPSSSSRCDRAERGGYPNPGRL